MRRLLVLLAIVAGLSIAASPALAADGFHYQERGSGVSVYFSDAAYDEDGWYLPGTYTETYVDASTYMVRDDGRWQYEYVCVGRSTFTITPEGDWIDEAWFGACSDGVSFALGKKLANGSITASFIAQDCLAWDEETGECLEPVMLGTVDIDLDLTANAPLERYHGTSSGGVAGQYQYTSHGTGTQRTADVTGSVTLDGVSLTESATMAVGWMFQTKSGYMEVWH